MARGKTKKGRPEEVDRGAGEQPWDPGPRPEGLQACAGGTLPQAGGRSSLSSVATGGSPSPSAAGLLLYTQGLA